MAIVAEKFHLFIEWKSEKFLALGKNFVHKVLAYSMIDKVEKPRIGARLLLFAMKCNKLKIRKKFMRVSSSYEVQTLIGLGVFRCRTSIVSDNDTTPTLIITQVHFFKLLAVSACQYPYPYLCFIASW